MIISLNSIKTTVFVIEKYFAVREIGTEFSFLIRSTENRHSSVIVHIVSQNFLCNLNQEIL
jgi:hypothetical protein